MARPRLRTPSRLFFLTGTGLLALSAWVGAQQRTPAATMPPGTQRATTAPATMPRGTSPGMLPASPSSGPGLSPAEKEQFLHVGRVVETKELDTGITKSYKLTLSDGRLTHAAHWQVIDVYQPVFKGKDGTVEKNFRDTYKFNIAAYRLAKLLHIENMVPPSVEREINGKIGSLTWWADDVKMTEKERRDQKIPTPSDQIWVNQLNTVRVFDQLIYNTDRNQGNLLITNDWQVKMIDHTRAFRTSPTLLNAGALTRCDYKLLQSLKALKAADLNRELTAFLRPEEIRAILTRRDVIVNFFQNEIQKKGDFSVLTDMPRSTPNVVIP